MEKCIQILGAKTILIFFLLSPSIVLGNDFEMNIEMLKKILRPHLPASAENITVNIDSITSDLNEDGQADAFGYVQYSLSELLSRRDEIKSKLFVALKNKNGDYSLNAISKEFELGHKANIEWTEKIGKNNFSVQFNARTVCGVYVDKYKIKLINGKWRVTGLDESDSVCPDDENSVVGLGPSYRKSHNFLTGEYLVKYYKAGKDQRSKKLQRKPQIYHLNDFDPYGIQIITGR
jgi:hypothetical protein